MIMKKLLTQYNLEDEEDYYMLIVNTPEEKIKRKLFRALNKKHKKICMVYLAEGACINKENYKFVNALLACIHTT